MAEASPEYMAFVLVPVFFTLGLLGVLICHLLKRRGYRCTTGEPPAEGEEPEEDLELGGGEGGRCEDVQRRGNMSDRAASVGNGRPTPSLRWYWPTSGCILYGARGKTWAGSSSVGLSPPPSTLRL